MINPDEQRPISFRHGEQPELTEIPQEAIEADRKAAEERNRKNLDWLNDNNDWSPFGEEW